VTGYATYATFANADHLFGAEQAAVSSDVSSKLTAYAEYAASGSHGGLNASALEQILRIQHDLIFNKNVTIGETITASFSGYLLTAWWCLLPFSRGSVHLASIDSYDSPMIDPQYFVADIDLTTQVAIGKHAQSFWHSRPVADIAVRNLTADPASDEEWAEYITNTCQYPYAPDTTTCTNQVPSRA
jgi:choline dehydrogenase